MQRYFVEPALLSASEVTISGDDVHHIVHVMRYQTGQEMIVCDGQGRVALARLSQLSAKEVKAKIVRYLEETTEMPIRVTIGQGLPKADKMEWILQKGTELGAYAFQPFSSERTIVKLDPKKEGKKLERWGKIVKEAAEQSHRSLLPQVLPTLSFKQVVGKAREYTRAVIAFEKERGTMLHQVLKELSPGESLLVLIGPEGGFSEAEVAFAEAAGVIPVGLGPRILRTETASAYALAAASYQFEQTASRS